MFAVVFMVANMVVPELFPAILKSPINAGAFCMLAGLVLVPVVSVCTPKPEKSHIDHAFSCYEQKVLVRQSDALASDE